MTQLLVILAIVLWIIVGATAVQIIDLRNRRRRTASVPGPVRHRVRSTR